MKHRVKGLGYTARRPPLTNVELARTFLKVQRMGSSMRGLTQFIGDIRNCENKEQERKRVDKEMANIRKHFREATKLTP